MYTPEEIIKRLSQIGTELSLAPDGCIAKDESDIDIGIEIGEMGKTISIANRMVTRLINDIEDEAEKDRLAEEERERKLAEYRRQQAAAKALEEGPGGESDG